MGWNADSGTESFGALLRRFRGRMGLTQEELAERAGLHAQEISQLERGVVRRPRSTTVEFLADALKLDVQERDALVDTTEGSGREAGSRPTLTLEGAPDAVGRVGDAEALLASMPTDVLPLRAPLPAGSRMPLAPNPLFVGRGDELLHLAAALQQAGTIVALGQVVASTGLGGLGKTQLAVELVHHYGRFFAGGVFWLSFATADEIPLQVAACAGPDFETRPLEERVQRVKDAWQSAVPRLLVFDNCEEETLLDAWRPTSGGCRVLVTSRRSHWSPTLGVTALPLDLLPRLDSVALLRRYRPDVALDDAGLDAIAHELGDLPLALHLAGSYLRLYGAEVGLDGYLEELRRAELVRHASLLGARLDDSPSPTHHVQSVAQTFALCLARLDREREVDRVALTLLARIAWMAPGEAVPRKLLAKTLADGDPLRADGLRRLAAVGLVEEGDGWLRLHRLLAHFVREEGLDPSARPAVGLSLMNCGREADEGHLNGPDLAAVIPHLVSAASTHVGDEARLAGLYNAAGLALYNAGDLQAARQWLQHAVEARARRLGAEHPDTASSLSDLAVLLWAQGELTAAKALNERALAIRESVLGSDHPDTAESLSNLALLLRNQGDLSAAKTLIERAIAIRDRVLGHDHPQTIRALNNLALVLLSQGNLAAARPLFEHALAFNERVLGPGHPHTAAALNNLALVLLGQGELAAARPHFERALAVAERALGRHHPNTAFAFNNLAVVLRDQGDPAAARPHFERALAIRERVLGPDHPDTVATRRALAELVAEGDGPQSPDRSQLRRKAARRRPASRPPASRG